MPIFFVGYALAVWWLAALHRRRGLGFLSVGLGLAGLIAINLLHTALSEATGGAVELPILRSLMYPYTGFVAAVGLYIACLPRRSASGCASCGYDLSGLRALGPGPRPPVRCPECGVVDRPSGRRYRPSGSDRADLTASDAGVDVFDTAGGTTEPGCDPGCDPGGDPGVGTGSGLDPQADHHGPDRQQPQRQAGDEAPTQA